MRPLLRFAHVEEVGGIVLLISAAIALFWANAPFGDSYESFWNTPIEFTLGSFHIEETLRLMVNDGLMTIFFFVVGLEIKRELVTGDLRNPKAAALPVVAALGGMIVPAAIFLAFNGGTDASHGWGIPMATDIAFAVGVVALVGHRVPIGAKLFLLALAIVDDIGAILVIAVFYTEDLAIGYLTAAIVTLVVIRLSARAHVRSILFYAVAGTVAWFFLLESGVHATLAGVALGLMTPARAMYTDREYHERASRILDRYEFDASAPSGPDRVDHEALALAQIARESVSPLARIEDALLPWSSFLVVPLFALANAGVSFRGVSLADSITHPVALGVALGLLVGKMVGITFFAWLAVRLRLGVLPLHTRWGHIVGVATVGGIGFTVALFVASLAYTDPTVIDLAKTGIFAGSLVAGITGFLLLRFLPAGRSPKGP